MIDSPETLHSGADLVMSLTAYMLPTAFKSLASSGDKESNPMFDQGQETDEERMMRERKTSLLRLFTEIGLKPQKKATLTGTQPKGKQFSSENTSPTKKGVKKEIVGDGEEIEVEDGEDLSENELNVIYKRFVEVPFELFRIHYSAVHSKMIVTWVKWNLRILSLSNFEAIKSRPYCMCIYLVRFLDYDCNL